MAATPTPGTDAAGDSSSYGGPGWRPRARTHAEEVQAGRPWGTFGVASEVAPLREILLAWPGEELSFSGDPDEQLMDERIDLTAIQQQATSLAHFYRSRNVIVHSHRPSSRPPPNFIFMRDLFFMTPEGAVLARMASEQRSGEERFAAEALAALGIPILMCPRGSAVFEGADALWLDSGTVLMGLGRRTNLEALRQVGSLLESMGVEVLPINLSAGVQHLLGAVTLLDGDLAAIRRGPEAKELMELLRARGYQCIEFLPDEEFTLRRAMNVVVLAPREIVMQANCPRARSSFEGAGVTCHEVDVSQYVRGAGAHGCLTGIVRRGA